MSELVERLEFDAVFFGQDWGGLVGLRVVAEIPDRFSHIVVSNTHFRRNGARIGYPLLKLAVWWEGEMTFEEMIWLIFDLGSLMPITMKI